MEKYEHLIDKVREHPVLYNYNVLSYRDHAVRQESWEKIGRDLRITSETAKATWEKLRRCFTNAINRRRARSSSHLSQRLSQPWKYERRMSFLLPFTEHRKNETVRDEIRYQDRYYSGDDEARMLTIVHDHDGAVQTFSDNHSEEVSSDRNLSDSFSPWIIKRETSESPEIELSHTQNEIYYNSTSSVTNLKDSSNHSTNIREPVDNSKRETTNCYQPLDNSTREAMNSKEPLDNSRRELMNSRESFDSCSKELINLRNPLSFSRKSYKPHDGYESCNKCLASNIKRKRPETDMDETDMFFLSMAKMTKKLPSINQAEIKMLLSNAVFQAQIQQHRNLSPATHLLQNPHSTKSNENESSEN